jgi:hypothetical protein
MTKATKQDYTAFQNSVLDKLTDNARDESEEILNNAPNGVLSEEDREKLKATDVAGNSWLNDFGKKPR